MIDRVRACACATAVQTKKSTVKYRRTCLSRQTELALGCRQASSSRRAPSTSPGFRSTINFATSSSARGPTAPISSTCVSVEKVSTSPTTFTTANGCLSVPRNFYVQSTGRSGILWDGQTKNGRWGLKDPKNRSSRPSLWDGIFRKRMASKPLPCHCGFRVAY